MFGVFSPVMFNASKGVKRCKTLFHCSSTLNIATKHTSPRFIYQIYTTHLTKRHFVQHFLLSCFYYKKITAVKGLKINQSKPNSLLLLKFKSNYTVKVAAAVIMVSPQPKKVKNGRGAILCHHWIYLTASSSCGTTQNTMQAVHCCTSGWCNSCHYNELINSKLIIIN